MSLVHPPPSSRRIARAFTLLEVMIAMAVFFIVVFAILGTVMQSLHAARALQRPHADPSLIAARLSLTNCFTEGASEQGDFEQFENSTWMWEAFPEGTNNMLWKVRIAVFEKTRNGKSTVEEMEILMARPDCAGAGIRR